ncbi:hypothetical protein ACFYXQ_29570 [Nocardia jiangxiensis]|uniref:Mce-associated membrane protein n=1 Tax=Nocardia jiangxiensis TaxID=282685 RepID=A0ABW6S6M9_9NOCA
MTIGDTPTDTSASAQKTETSTSAAHPSRPRKPAGQPRQVSLRLSTAVTGAVIAGLLIATCVFATLYLRAQHDISGRDTRAAEDKHAEQVATDYALGASTIDYRDTKTWFDRLKANTTAQLAAKFDASAPQLEQILLPLQWTSKATPITTTVTAQSDGVYHVSAFLNVNSTSVQTPQGGITTVAYTLTVDKNAGWKVTEVGGGLDSALPAK